MFGRRTQKKLDDIHHAVSNSFSKVRSDTTTLSEWIRYLHARADTHQQALHNIFDTHRSFLGKQEAQEILKAQQMVASFGRQLSAMEDRLRKLEGAQQRLIEQKPAALPTVKVRQTRLQEKIVRKVGQQSKDYIKKTVLSLIEKYDRISGVALREMLVEEQKLCSRSSFYRVLEELASSDAISTVSSGKEKVFAANRKLFK